MPGTCGSWEGNNQSLFPPPPHHPPQGGSRESCKECRLQGMNPPSPPLPSPSSPHPLLQNEDQAVREMGCRRTLAPVPSQNTKHSINGGCRYHLGIPERCLPWGRDPWSQGLGRAGR